MEAARLASANGPRLGEPSTALSFKNLTLSLPDGRRLLDNANLSLPPGQPRILTGASGVGKSHPVPGHGRHLAVWPWRDHAALPAPCSSPCRQRPYFPLGSLKR